MMKKLWIGLLLCAGSLAVQAGVSHRYTFEGNVRDTVGAKHGTATAAGTYTEAPQFTADIPTGAVESAPKRSIEFGMTNSKKSGFTLSEFPLSSQGSYSVWLKADTLTGGNYILLADSLKLLNEGAGLLKTAYNGWTSLRATSISSDKWVHVVVTWDNSKSEMAYYVNGVRIALVDDATVGSFDRIRFGGYSLSDSAEKASNQFDGKLYDLQFYNHSLRAKEVAYLHSNPGSEAVQLADFLVPFKGWHPVQCEPVTVAGRSAWKSLKAKEEHKSRFLSFDIQDPLLKNGNTKTVTLTLTYLDQFKVPLILKYDSSDQSAGENGIWKQLPGVTTGDSGEWKTASWTLDDALFRSRCHGHDFRITVGGDVDFIIEDCTVLGTPKQTLIVPDVFSDNMILQRNAPIPVWGWADDGTVVTVTFAGYDLDSTARDGKWQVVFPPMKANKTPQTMTVSTDSNIPTLQYSNILVGDVWLASGQSNMEMMLKEEKGGAEAVSASENPLLRLFKVPRCLESTVAPVGTTWSESNPGSSAGQSAVGYFFVSELQEELDIPVGLLQCAYGGTVTETWCSPEVLEQGWPDWELFEENALRNPEWPRRNTSSELYNRMLKTVMPFPVKGFIWYQGEGNASRAEEQKALFPNMVADWRKSWGNDELPFYIVQLARYEAADWHEFRCAQLDVWKNTPDSYMAVTIDLSKDWNADNHPIHPSTKAPIGHRLALAARATVYGETDLVYSGPIIRSMEVKNEAMVLSFDHIGSGLIASDNQPLRGFYISADGERFVEASAEIKGDTVIVQSSNVRNPVAVRYGAEVDMDKEALDVNLANQEMLPASPFTVNLN
ncbi:sialate O-acetylesterase [Pontiella sulfatireligans]|uniref:Sialate O-acetylesterase domain-containing protein n=1 Tax=Pontiella sulfatireligans TaxID=2750658 RepID=A0A6C2UP47_9BACT|nr:sialate O-acetylesterase [Pontiella sulfatireligans]VGO21968.1 hypothetical protein SCARR_04048 [Pontiella sulfatireligans]